MNRLQSVRRGCLGNGLFAGWPRGLLAGLAAAAVLGGCATSVPVDEGEGTRLRPPPAGTTASRVLVSSTVPVDTMGNGHGDRFTVVVYLFGSMDQYPLPFWETGSFEFLLREPGAEEEKLRWMIPASEARAARQLLQPGPAYMFDLSVIEAGGPGADVFPAQSLELVVRFYGERTGLPVEGRPHPIRLGGTGEARGSGRGSGGR
ncbi:MAG: hypothetical protein EA378_05255 [Phycisphaerales bacterium]|nr:MAG: hypothetical protein EA378_05255 [Phycisphaerales bacterium]